MGMGKKHELDPPRLGIELFTMGKGGSQASEGRGKCRFCDVRSQFSDAVRLGLSSIEALYREHAATKVGLHGG